GLPVCVYLAQLIHAQRGPFDCGSSRPVSADALVSLNRHRPPGWGRHHCVLLFITLSLRQSGRWPSRVSTTRPRGGTPSGQTPPVMGSSQIASSAQIIAPFRTETSRGVEFR